MKGFGKLAWDALAIYGGVTLAKRCAKAERQIRGLTVDILNLPDRVEAWLEEFFRGEAEKTIEVEFREVD